MSRVKGFDDNLANNFIETLKKSWHKDIVDKIKQNEDNKDNNDNSNEEPKELSISQAKRQKNGFVKVKGTIIGLTSVYNLIKSVTLTCDSWGYIYK